jgi:hypothetical protein
MSDMDQFTNLNEDDNDDEDHWYHPRASSPPSSLSVNNSFTPQSSSATIGSWGFDVNRSTNGQTPLSFTSNNNNNNDQQTIMRITKDYNERFVDISSSPQNFKSRTPALTRHKNGNEFSAVDRLVLGPNRIVQTDRNPSDDSFQQPMIPTNPYKIQTEQELLAWQNRMLERFILIFYKLFFVINQFISRDQRFVGPSLKLTNKRNNRVSVIGFFFSFD